MKQETAASVVNRLAGGRVRPLRWWALAITLYGCGTEEASDRDALLSRTMPTLREEPIGADQRAVGSVLSRVAVGYDGAVLVLPAETRGPSFALVGAPDGQVLHYGGLGEGPGEMRMAFPLIVDDSMVLGVDLATQRVIVYDRRSTRVQREFRPSAPVVPFLRGPEGTLLASRHDQGTELPALVDLATGRVRNVVPPSDSYRVELFADDDRYAGGSLNTTVLGRWRDGVVIGNGMTYRLGLYSGNGELRHRIGSGIAPRRLTKAEIALELSRLANTPLGRTPERLALARERLEATPTRWFTHRSPPRDDGRGRLWVLVEYGDSTSADIYAGEQLLGRAALDCPGFAGQWDLSGEWLVLLCLPADLAATHDAEVRRWRIIESDV